MTAAASCPNIKILSVPALRGEWCVGKAMISVRRMSGEDIAVSQALLTQLGWYPLDTLEVRRRYDAVVASKDHF
jgi:hypothetical protein